MSHAYFSQSGVDQNYAFRLADEWSDFCRTRILQANPNLKKAEKSTKRENIWIDLCQNMYFQYY